MQVTLNPVSYDLSDVYYLSAEGLDNPIGKGTESEVCARIYANSGKVVDNYIYYQFDFSSIPSYAVINSISLSIKGSSAANTSGLKWFGGYALYKNRTNTLVSTTWFTTSVDTSTQTATTVTRDELSGVEIKITGYRSIIDSGTAEYYIDFYGAELVIDYSLPEGLYIKKDSQYQYVDTVYKKIDGVYVAQEDIATLFDENVNYVHVT